MKTAQKIYRIFHILSLLLLVYGCANPVAPTGGPKDETPPSILKMDPPNYSTSVNGANRFSIQFDEFVKLQGLNSQLMISPPLDKVPNVRTKGRSVIMDIDENLMDSTTYTFYFGDAIVDLTEGNAFKNFEYVFSTGPLLDSMAVRGKVMDAFKNTPREGVAVMLYILDADSIPNDSLPILNRPVYVSRTNKEGEFELNNLRNIPYKLVALHDMNSNYLYDLPNEEIAYSDTIIMPAYLGRKTYESPSDSSSKDTVAKIIDEAVTNFEKLAADSIDSTQLKPQEASIKLNYKPLELFMFPVIDSTQQIVESLVTKGNLITFRLKFPCKDFQLVPLNFSADLEWNILETNRTNDTILCWVKPGIQDSLQIEFISESIILDTLDFVLNKVNPNIQIDTTKKEPFAITNNLRLGVIELNKKLILESEYPLATYDFSAINWYEADTLGILPSIIFKDSAKRIFYFDKQLEEKVNYKIIIPDSAMVDMKGRISDSIVYEFKTREKEEYGTIFLNVAIQDTTQQWIFQLINDKAKVIGQQIINKSQPIRFDFLNPAKYTLKAILDKNKNAIWDTGNYIKHRQAEKVLLFKTELDVRANWVIEENWGIN